MYIYTHNCVQNKNIYMLKIKDRTVLVQLPIFNTKLTHEMVALYRYIILHK